MSGDLAEKDRATSGQGLRVAVVAPRYHQEIVGGSERYLAALCEGLAARGVAVEVVTTRSMDVDLDGDDAVRWADETPADEPASRVVVRRYPVRYASPRDWRRWRAVVSRAAGAAAERVPVARSGPPHFGRGFWGVEGGGATRPFRWCGGEGTLVLGGEPADAIAVELHAMHGVELALACDGVEIASLRIEPNVWRRVEVTLPPGPARQVTLRVDSTLRPANEERELGVAVSAVALTSATGSRQLPLDHDEAWVASALPTGAVAAAWDARARLMPWRAGLADARLKGPWSPALARGAWRAARRADVVLATNAPYATLPIGWIAARLARTPFVALPFFHLRDSHHHLPQVRVPLAHADAVFCLTETFAAFVEERLGARAVWLGGGVDLAELGQAGISGERFRARHRLGDDRLVLQAGRKTPAKGYRETAEAVARLRAGGLNVRFVHIGPDEDGEQLESAGALVLGRVERGELLDALAACDVFALPSIHESFGLAYLEAWALGRPVVGHARCDAARELITAGENGELVATVGELTAALARLVRRDGYGTRLGERGRDKAAGCTWDGVAERAIGLFAELAGRSR